MTTIKIEKLLEQGNAYLASNYSTAESRVGAYVLLEGALHLAKRYKGWGLLAIGDQRYDPVTKKWNITDESRRFYY